MEVQDIFEDIANPDPANDNQHPYAVCIRKLDHHFRAEENISFKQHMFRQMVPNERERVDEYLVHLRQQPRHCNFGVGGIRSNISNMRRSVSSPDETPRRELKIRRAAEYF